MLKMVILKLKNRGLFGWMPHFIPSCLARYFTLKLSSKSIFRRCLHLALVVYYYFQRAALWRTSQDLTTHSHPLLELMDWDWIFMNLALCQIPHSRYGIIFGQKYFYCICIKATTSGPQQFYIHCRISPCRSIYFSYATSNHYRSTRDKQTM